LLEQAYLRARLLSASTFGAIFVSMELSRSKWLITSLSPGGGEKMSKHTVAGGDLAGLFERFALLQEKARARTGQDYRIIVIQEAGLDGFWIHRALEQAGIESHVADPASIAVSQRVRRAKTDKIDGEALVRALLAYKRGEPRVCSMVRPPNPEEEDRRRILRERKALTAERVRQVNHIKGLLFAQGLGDYEPMRRNRRARLEALRTGDGRELPGHLKTQILRELDRLELHLSQIKALETERDDLLATDQAAAPSSALSCGQSACSEASRTDARWPPTPALRPRLGRAGRLTASRAYPRLATHASGPP
jgi:transposase